MGEMPACNRASADFAISSPLFTRRYDRLQLDFANYPGDSKPMLASAARTA